LQAGLIEAVAFFHFDEDDFSTPTHNHHPKPGCRFSTLFPPNRLSALQSLCIYVCSVIFISAPLAHMGAPNVDLLDYTCLIPCAQHKAPQIPFFTSRDMNKSGNNASNYELWRRLNHVLSRLLFYEITLLAITFKELTKFPSEN